MQERTVSTAAGWPETIRDMTPADVATLEDAKA